MAASGPPPDAARPVLPVAGTTRARTSVTRRRLVMSLGALGAAVLLVGTGFLAGLHFRSGGTASLVSAPGAGTRGPGGQAWDGQGGPFGGYAGGDGAPGGAGAPGGSWTPGGGDGDGGVGGEGNGRSNGPGDLGRAGLLAGRITGVESSGFTLADGQGQSLRVGTTSSTVVAGSVGGDLGRIAVGQPVVVIAVRAQDGSFTAQAIIPRGGRLPGTGGSRSGSPAGSVADFSA